MDTFELNKWAGAILGSLLVLMLVNEIGNLLVRPRHLEKAAIAINVPDDGGAAASASAAKAEPEKPLGELLAAGDPASGEKVAKKCATCHTFNSGGANKIGPNLHNIVGGKKAGSEGFSYSNAMQGKGGNWSYEDLNAFLADPKGFVAGTKMTFAGLKKGQERADLIAYLRQRTEAPPPLPGK
jgi:cytochrome c